MAHKVLDLGAYRLKPQVPQRILREKLRKERQFSSSAVGEQEDFVQLLFGKGHLDLRLPKDIDVTVVRKPEMKGVSDPESEVRATLSPLEQSAATATSACILICDITRPVPNGVLLPPIIDILRCAGVSDITILVATGLHRPNLGVELGRLLTQGSDWELGEAMATWLQDVRVENHYARNDEDHVSLGKTSRGTAVKLDKRFVDADLKIVTGLVEPHFMAGWSGGRKVIAPGT